MQMNNEKRLISCATLTIDVPDNVLLKDYIQYLQTLINEDYHRQTLDRVSYGGDENDDFVLYNARLETDEEYSDRLKKQKIADLQRLSEKNKKLQQYNMLKEELRKNGWLNDE